VFLLAHVEMFERGHEILNERVELPARDPHAFMGCFHTAARVRTGSPGCFADLIDQHLPEAHQVCPGKFLVDAGPGKDQISAAQAVVVEESARSATDQLALSLPVPCPLVGTFAP